MKNKKVVSLITKILMVVALPLIVIVAFGAISIDAIGMLVAERMAERELSVAAYTMKESVSNMNLGEYTLNGDILYKGATNMTQEWQGLDKFREANDVDTTFFVGKTRRATSIKDGSGNKILNTALSDEVYNEVKENKTYFSSHVDVEGVSYYGYYELLDEKAGGEDIILFTGLNAADTHEVYYTRMYNTILVLIVFAILVCVLCIILVRRIVKAIGVSVGSLDRVAEGELNVEIGKKLVERRDEVGNIARAVHSLMDKLKTIVQNLRSSSVSLNDFSDKFKKDFESINESINNINIAVEEIATGATSQADETQRVTEEMTDMTIAVEQVSKSTDSLRKSADNMMEQNQRADVTLDELIGISERTREAIGTVHRQTDLTNQSVMEIREVLEFITDIAEQTNLLSLNASIEAARAGDQGRGFAVVADEVRTLADQTGESIQKISEVMEELVRNSNISVEAMGHVMEEMKVQNDKLASTKNVFEKLNEEITTVTQAVDNISDDVHSINRAQDTIAGSLESLAAIAEENAAGTEETSATMMGLSELVDEANRLTGDLVTIADVLDGNVQQFKL